MSRATGRTAKGLGLLLLGFSLLGSTCVVVEEEPYEGTYGEESNAEAMQEEQAREVITDSER